MLFHPRACVCSCFMGFTVYFILMCVSLFLKNNLNGDILVKWFLHRRLYYLYIVDAYLSIDHNILSHRPVFMF